MDGHERQRHSQSIDGIDVLTLGNKGCMELVVLILSTKKLIKSTLLARPTAVDVFGKYAIILV